MTLDTESVRSVSRASSIRSWRDFYDDEDPYDFGIAYDGDSDGDDHEYGGPESSDGDEHHLDEDGHSRSSSRHNHHQQQQRRRKVRRRSSVMRTPKAHMSQPFVIESNGSSPMMEERLTEMMQQYDSEPLNGDLAGGLGYSRSMRMQSSTHQTIALEEDLQCDIYGYSIHPFKYTCYLFGCVLSVGVLFLLCRWFPRLYISFTCRRTPFHKCQMLFIKSTWKHVDIVPIQVNIYEDAAELHQILSMNATSLSRSPSDYDAHTLKSFDYHCMKFVYNPITSLFIENTAWRDSREKSVPSLSRGLSTRQEVQERQLLFGKNSIDIPIKSDWKLLVDEILHPFYVFQLFSIMLWIAENYYYYAACIFLISTGSSVSALLETKRNLQRLRDMTHHQCSVNVLRSGVWIRVSSQDLVPGDVYDLSSIEEYRDEVEQESDDQVDIDDHDDDKGRDFGVNDMVIPCDSIMINGDCIVNESMLTGESVPVPKIPLSNHTVHQLDDLNNIDSKHYLYNGTKIVRVRTVGKQTPTTDQSPNTVPSHTDGIACAMAVRTGFNTTKGSLIRAILYPKPTSFKFYEDSFKFIGILACIALVGFIYSIYQYVKGGAVWWLVVIRAFDLFTIVVPPALPAAMSVGIAFAIARLKHRDIYCISPPRINVCGKLDLFVFDKTGTLTEEGLDVLGVIESSRGGMSDLITSVDDSQSGNYSKFQQIPSNGDQQQQQQKSAIDIKFVEALASCHSIKVAHGVEVGDPLDLKMMAFTNWVIDEPENHAMVYVRPKHCEANQNYDLFTMDSTSPTRSASDMDSVEMAIIKEFEFVSSLRRMSVIVKKLHDKSVKVYCKGAPEVLISLCTPESVPQDFMEVVDYHAQNGHRIIAFAGKQMVGVNWRKSQSLDRGEVESDLHLLGIMVFENKLKEESDPTIRALTASQMKSVMCTGDNLLTAVNVGKDCSIISHNAAVYVPRFEVDFTGRDIVQWRQLLDDSMTLDPQTLCPLQGYTRDSQDSLRENGKSQISSQSSVDAQQIKNMNANGEMKMQKKKKFSVASGMSGMNGGQDIVIDVDGMLPEYTLACTGDVFQYLIGNLSQDMLRLFLSKTSIYARMSPDQKCELVERFMSFGYCVSMVGDGANDCAALRASDVGISLSENESSVAAPLTSTVTNISCVLDVVRQGRAALVTSFTCFKFIALYSMIQFTSACLLYTLTGNLGDFQYLYIDVFLILPLALFMGKTEAADSLSIRRPTASLVSRKVIVSLLGQTMLQFAFQLSLFMIVKQQSWYEPPDRMPEEKNIRSFENTCLFKFSTFLYMTVAVVFNRGPPFRRAIYTNAPFVISVIILLCISVMFVLWPPQFVKNVLEFEEIPPVFGLFILALAAVAFTLSWLSEYVVFPIIDRSIGRLSGAIARMNRLTRRDIHYHQLDDSHQQQ
ncbi:hypothetical protein MIR68_004178 [Amoeboaphelidium protococcarum]|nr:hypothetical protein MIR68_004178 [Amoeboaphelidium protococcarum]